MAWLRTPDDRFANLDGYPFAPHYADVDGVRIHYVDEGAPTAAPVLLLHGQPTWSYLYRHMIPPLVRAGYRAVAPDLPGFGKSDKPDSAEPYTYQTLVDWMTHWLKAVDLNNITLFCQDWGSLIGLRLAVGPLSDRFDRIVLANGGLPTGDQSMPRAFEVWVKYVARAKSLDMGTIVQNGTVRQLTADEMAAYDAPFPNPAYQVAAKLLPSLVPTSPDNPATKANRRALLAYRQWEKPFVTAFSDQDPITRGADALFQTHVPGAQGQPHTTIKEGGHFLQEDQPAQLADIITTLLNSS